MAKFYIDFSGYCAVEAETKEEAEEKFWNTLQKPCESCYEDIYGIDSIEQVK